MRALHVNFAERRTLWPWLAIALTVLLIVLAIHQAWAALELVKQARRAESEVGRLALALEGQRKLAGKASTAAGESWPAYSKDALELSKLASFDTGSVLRALESVQVAGVNLTSLEVLATPGTVRAELEVADPAALLQYLEQLNEGTDAASRWHLLRSQSPSPPNLGTATISLSGVLPTR
jgi:hypothetical protein